MNFLPKAAHKMFYKNILYSGVNPWQFVRKIYYSNNEFRDFCITKYMIFIYLQIVGQKGRFSNGKSGIIIIINSKSAIEISHFFYFKWNVEVAGIEPASEVKTQ